MTWLPTLYIVVSCLLHCLLVYWLFYPPKDPLAEWDFLQDDYMEWEKIDAEWDGKEPLK